MTAAVFIALLVVGIGPGVLLCGWMLMSELRYRKDAKRKARRLRQRRMNAYTQRVPW